MLTQKKFLSSCRNLPSESGSDDNKKEKPRKKYKCKVCRELFDRRNSMQIACSPKCAMAYAASISLKAAAQREQEERKKTRVQREALKSKSQWTKETQVVFNKFIRARDEKEPCISCGNTRPQSKYNAGHYLSCGAHPELRFNEDNVHKQCEHCNTHLSGNISAYRPRLIEKIGIARVEALEGPHEPAKWSIDELKAIKAEYKAKLKQLQAAKGEA